MLDVERQFLAEVFVLIIIRAKFARKEELKYISHLDMMKMFERALRRSRLPIYYSQGFNPHPQIVFGLPLSVGVTSDAEYVDFELSEDVEADKFVEVLNNNMPEGIDILEAKLRTSKSNIMASISKASYEVLIGTYKNTDEDELNTNILRFLDKSEIVIQKQSKRKVRDVNIKPMIHKFKARFIGNNIEDIKQNLQFLNMALFNYIEKIKNFYDLEEAGELKSYYVYSLLLSAGSVANLKPEYAIKAFSEFSGLDLNVLKVHRTGLFVDKGEKTLNPLDNELLAI